MASDDALHSNTERSSTQKLFCFFLNESAIVYLVLMKNYAKLFASMK